MGLFTALLTLPLAPLRGTVWVAEKLQEQAERELYDETWIEIALIELQEARERGDFDAEEIERAEDELIERLMVMRGYSGGNGDGAIG